ncbi:MAG: DegT/DnrJ/EryC1/StrS family aminotransferase [Candidatus Sumerlaeaceae bacterium]|jgi:dTDP-4-amino-4,6-dideoxygalactose transaminase
MRRIPFGDLSRHYACLREEIDSSIRRVLERGWFVLGEEGKQFEEEWATFVGATEAVGCGSGTEAIHLALWAHGVGPGDYVVTVPNTCVPTVAGISLTGAKVLLCDVNPETALMDPAWLEDILAKYPVKAVVPVHLYGTPADLSRIAGLAAQYGAIVVDDAAQAHAAKYRGRPVGAQGFTTCWSFYPSKNLGAFGDAGAVTAHSPQIAERLRMLRNYGQERRYYHKIPGTNSRLDEIQAAILRVKLPHLAQWTARREEIAKRYRSEIKNSALCHFAIPANVSPCYHLYPVRTSAREKFIGFMAEKGVECLVHYPVPIHLQEAYQYLGYRKGDFPNAERLCDEVVSLPMFPELTDEEVDHVIHAANAYEG